MNSSVLIVDDNLDFKELLEFALKQKGHDVDSVNSGEEVLEFLKHSPAPDLMILDVLLPDMTGPELLDRLQEDRPHFCEENLVVYCTAGDRPEDPRVKRYLNKMTDLHKFLKEIEEILSSRQQGRSQSNFFESQPRP